MKSQRFLSLNLLNCAIVSALPSLTSERLSAKPVYLQPLGRFMGFEIQPVTLILSFISLWILYVGVIKVGEAEASHILLKGIEEENKEKLLKVKAEVGEDIEKFRAAAREMSDCPSGKSRGGYLGTFPAGTMVPPFEKCLWDETNPEGKVTDPVVTSFGWHLIFIHKRKKAWFE